MTDWKLILGKYIKANAYGIVATAIIVLAATLRTFLIALGWPPLDSDEGMMGLMGMHIAFHGEWPLFYYGQGYMGTLEAYLAAIFFQLFGVSTFTLLLGLVIMYTVFLIAMYRLTSLLYSKGLALVVIVLLCLGSNPMLSRELVAIGGYPETLLFGTIIMLLALWLALTSRINPSEMTRPERRKRLRAYALWGFVVGLGLWTHMLVLPFALLGTILILLFCWRELRVRVLLCTIIPALIGMAPMIIYNIIAAPGQDTLTYLLKVHGGPISASDVTQPLWPLQLKGTFLVGLPMATGVSPLCNSSQIDFTRLGAPDVLGCTLVNTGWMLGVIALWFIAAIMAFTALFQLRRERPWSPAARTEIIKNTTRLALLVTTALTLFLYAISPDSALFPVATSRYLIGVLVSLPVLLWPLWHVRNVAKPVVLNPLSRVVIAIRAASLSTIIRRGILLLIGIVFLIGTTSIFTGFPSAPPVEQRWGRFATQVNDQHLDLAAVQQLNQQQYALVHDLLQSRIVHVYSDYWTCNRLMFQSQERIICSVLEVSQFGNTRTGQNRYPLYGTIVTSDHQSSYLFVDGSPEAQAFQRYVYVPHSYRLKRLSFDGYVIFEPDR